MRASEREFIAEIKNQASRSAGRARGSSLLQGIGDDCAVISYTRQRDLLVTTDLFLEGIHFRREWQPARSVGYKALARSFSDIAAMGGTPRYAFLSLALPKKIEQRWAREFLRGFLRLADTEDVVLAGGDTSASQGGVMADVMVIGEVAKGQAVRRGGARPGDEIWVTGTLGQAARALSLLEAGEKPQNLRLPYRAFFYPQARLEIGSYLRQRKLATAMIDISDGLSIDLARLCEESGTGARILEEAIPRSPQATLRQVLHGGEDLELLFTIPAERSRKLPASLGGVTLTRIGKIVRGRNLRIMRGRKARPLPVLGFQHF